MEKSPHTVNFPPRLRCTGASRESLSAWWSSGLSAAFQLPWANFLASFIARKGHPREDKGRFPRALPPAPLAGPTHLSGRDKLGSAEDNARDGPRASSRELGEGSPLSCLGNSAAPLGPPHQARGARAQPGKA